jgi:hypothetical protein
MLRNTAVLLTLCLLLFAVACDRGGASIAGIDSSTQLDALTSEQADDYCGYLQEEMKKKMADDTMKKAGCLFGGVMAAMFAGDEDGACQSAYDECLASEPEEEESFEDVCPSQEDLSGCSATLAEVTGCLMATVDHTFGALRELASLTCDDVAGEEGMAKLEEAMESMQGMEDGIPDIEACAAVREKCPDLG